jgi:DNA polymerase-3 subunit epsilon
MLVVGFDCETTGLDVAEERMTEVGAVLWDTDAKAPVCFYSQLIQGPIMSEMIIELTGIQQWMLDKYGQQPRTVFHQLHDFIMEGEAIVAHNGKRFDFPFLKNEFERYELPMPELVLVDTSVDVPYPAKIETRKQVHLAAEHGFVNPFPHRALTDVLTMLTTMSKYDFNEVFAMAQTPDITLRALVSFHNKDLAKNTGYRYQGESKTWQKVIKESRLNHEEELAKSKGFDIVVL